MYKCAFPECNHIADAVTNQHCISAHSMDRVTLTHLFGKPERLETKYVRDKVLHTDWFSQRGNDPSNMQRKMYRYYK